VAADTSYWDKVGTGGGNGTGGGGGGGKGLLCHLTGRHDPPPASNKVLPMGK